MLRLARVLVKHTAVVFGVVCGGRGGTVWLSRNTLKLGSCKALAWACALITPSLGLLRQTCFTGSNVPQ